MAITGTPVTGVTTTAVKRWWRTSIETPMGATPADKSRYTITLYREQWVFDQNNTPVAAPTKLQGITINQPTFAAMSFTLGATVLTGAQVLTLLENVTDQVATTLGQ